MISTKMKIYQDPKLETNLKQYKNQIDQKEEHKLCQQIKVPKRT